MQSGYIYKNGKFWTLRYYEMVLDNGREIRKQKAHKLAPVSSQYPNKTSVRHLADAFLAPLNGRQLRPESSQCVVDFLQHTYLPHVKATKRPSTCKGYHDMFKIVRDHLVDVTMHEFRTPEADALMRAVAGEKQRAHTTHRNLKSFLSGAFKYAKRNGAVNENPIRDVEIPRGKPKADRAPYTFDEVVRMVEVLPEPARTVVFTAALTGLRLSELKGLRWEDFDDDQMIVQRGVWRGQVNGTKTLTSRAAVPIIPFLVEQLENHKRHNSGTGYVFHGEMSAEKPLILENVYRRDMKEPFAKAKVNWRGWHPFRYGVGTILHSLGVDDKTIQQILRHANVSTTLAFYVKPPAAESRKAMDKLGVAFKSALAARKQA